MPNKVTDSYNLAIIYPSSIDFWDYESNGDLSPYMVTPASGLEVWWVRDCIHQNEVKRHRWTRRVDQSAANDFACPYCASSNARLLKGFNDLESQYPELVKEWDYDKNLLLPDEILCKSSKKVWWLKDCTNGVGKKHSWLSPISRRTTSGAGCIYCRRKNLLTGFNDLETKFPLVAKEWHPNKNDLKPNEITAINGRKVWWLCTNGHEWESVISSRTKGGNGCPYCGNQKNISRV